MPAAITAFFVKIGFSALAAAIASAVVQVAITVGLNVLVNAIFGPSRPKPSDGQQNIREAVGSRRRHYGIVHTGGQVSFIESRNGTIGQVITLGTGREGDIIEHRINDKVVTVAGGTVTDASFHGAMHIYTRSGTDDQTAIGELTAKFPEWTSDHRQRGCAHAAIIGDPVKQDKFSEVYNGQIPQYTQVRKGAFCYDPRKDSTAVIGFDGGEPVFGSGAHRLNNRATWEWTALAALVIADYFAHEDGYGAGFDNVNWANIAREADFCAMTETTFTGEEIERWRIWASYSLASEERKQVLTDMVTACDGFIWQDADGKFNLMTGRFEEPDIVITDDHILGMTATLGPKSQHRTSAMKVLYTDAAVGYREQESATVVADGVDEDPNTDPQSLQVFFAPHHNQAVRVGTIMLARLGDRWHLSLILNLFGLNLLGRRFCRVESASLGVSAPFIIVGLRLNQEACTIETTLDEVSAADWDFDAATQEGTPPGVADPVAADPAVPVPTGLDLSAEQIALGETNGVRIVATWDAGRADLNYQVQYRPTAGGDWVPMAVEEDARVARTGPVDSGTQYDVRIRALTLGGRTSDWSAVETITPTASAALNAPTELAALGGSGEADVSFRMPTQPSLAYARLYRNTANDFGTADQVGTDIVGGLGQVITLTDSGLSAGTFYYWARAFGSGGSPSPVAGPVSTTVT